MKVFILLILTILIGIILLINPKIKGKTILPIITKATYKGRIMTITFSNGSIEQYEGDCTVWYKYPMMDRCSSSKESQLCNIQKYIKVHGNDYPTAHLKKKIIMTKKELSQKLADNLGYYVANPKKRCVSKNGECRYSGQSLGIKTKGCFVGALLPAKLRKEIDDKEGPMSVSGLINNNKYPLPSIIKDNECLMQSFQVFHDKWDNWEEKGLSVAGKAKLKDLIEFHKLHKTPFNKFLK